MKPKFSLQIRKFINSFYKYPKKTHTQILTFMAEDTENILKIKPSSSGKSLIIITTNHVYKLMKPIDDISIELDESSDVNELIYYNKEAVILTNRCIKSDFIICSDKILINPNINIIRLEKIISEPSKCYNLKSTKGLVVLLYSVACALKDIHNSGYTHNDAYLPNIGCRKVEDDIPDLVLYDFELSKPLTSGQESEEMYNDVMNFLNSILNKYSDAKKKLIEDVIEKIEKKKKDTGKKRRSITRSFPIYDYTYRINDFKKIIINLIHSLLKK